MGKIVREPSIHILGETKNDFLGPLVGPLLAPYETYFNHIGHISFSLGPGPARVPLMEAEGYSRRGFFFPKKVRMFLLIVLYVFS